LKKEGERMNNQFKNDEIVQVNGKDYPVVGGRLRLAHDENEKGLSIETAVIKYEDGIAVIQATVTTEKGRYNGLGNATVQRDARLKMAILELAETRAIARALRFAGYGVEYTGFEEVDYEPEKSQKSVEGNNQSKDKPTGELISKAQANRMFAISGGNAEICKAVLKTFGYSKSEEVQKKHYEAICKAVEEVRKDADILKDELPWKD
jgi:hypothetical protein